MGSTHVYDIAGAGVPAAGKPAPVGKFLRFPQHRALADEHLCLFLGGLQVSLDPEELEGLDEEEVQKRYHMRCPHAGLMERVNAKYDITY